MIDGMSIREASREFSLHRDTVRKMLAHSVPPGYRRRKPPRRPKIGPYTGVIDRILEDDLNRPRKQRHTAKRIHERLRDEYGLDGGYTIVKDYVREHRRRTSAMWVLPVPLLPMAMTFSRRSTYSHTASRVTSCLFTDGIARKSKVSRLFTVGKRAALIRLSTIR